MRIERLSLRNFKCFESTTVPFEPGVTVVHGINGSGKSSLLEAAFFALYGANAIDRTLEEIVTVGAKESEVDLWFSHEGSSYHLHRRIRATGDRATTAACTLEGSEEHISGVTDVEAAIQSMLRMDAEAFVNSAFVRQGEINKLIDATPAARKRMIDRLLQLGRLETYRERAAQARLAVESLRERRKGRLETIEEQLEVKDRQALLERASGLETEIAELEEQIEMLERGREEARETKQAAESTIEAHERRREDLETIETRIDAQRETISEAEARRAELAEAMNDLEEEVSTLQAAVKERASDFDLGEADSETIEAAIENAREKRESLGEDLLDHRNRHNERTQIVETGRERVAEFEDRIESIGESIAELEERRTGLEESIEGERAAIVEHAREIESHLMAFEDGEIEFGEADDAIEARRSALSDLREEETDCRESIASVRSRIEEAEALLAEGKCPECGQDVCGSPRVGALESDREEVAKLESRQSSIEAEREECAQAVDRAESLREHEREIDRLTGAVERRGDRIASHRSELRETESHREELQAELADLRNRREAELERIETAKETAEGIRSTIDELNERRRSLDEQIQALEALLADVESIQDRQETIESHRQTREEIAERNEERRETLSEYRDRRRRLAEQIDEDAIEAARRDRRKAETYLERVGEDLQQLGEERDELQAELGAVKSELRDVEELEANRELVAEAVQSLETLHEELSTLERMYGDLRGELRQRNVARLGALFNETFDLVYRNDSYARLEIDEDYQLTVFQKDGSTLGPDQLSGGERALFNLSLRAAIYQLLVEGIDGAAPMPPLILDEPTVFLDAGHVSQLVALIEAMRDLGVEQIIVVSHDEELIGAAESLLRVEKDPTTNRSTVEAVSKALSGMN
ncbi:MAG: DNA double-strand break repair ATPase Rad50 [Halodesulfurarchaeum sp.]